MNFWIYLLIEQHEVLREHTLITTFSTTLSTKKSLFIGCRHPFYKLESSALESGSDNLILKMKLTVCTPGKN
jgi:hypothetical protein